MGTPGYMSPEQMDSTVADVDTRADVYFWVGLILGMGLQGKGAVPLPLLSA